MGRPKQQFQSSSSNPTGVTDATASGYGTWIDENQQESTGNEQLEVSGTGVINQPPRANPQAFPHRPQPFPPSQDEPEAVFHTQPQSFPPSQDEQPQAFPPQDGHHHHNQPQAFPPPQDEPQAFSQTQGGQYPQAFPPQQATFHQQQQQQNGMQFPQNANFFLPSTIGGGQIGASQGFPVINQNPIIQLPTENWKSGLLECMNDPTNALVTACFPCVTFGQIAEIIDYSQTSCATSGLLYGAIAFCIAMPCLMSCTYRTKLRSRYGLIETPAPDWIIHCFCECCALCQEYRELKERGLDPSIGWIGNLAKQKETGQMTPPFRQTMMG